MSENKEDTTPSLAKELATQAVSAAIVSAASVVGTYAAFAALGWYLQKKQDKKAENS